MSRGRASATYDARVLICSSMGFLWRSVWCVALLLLPELSATVCPSQCVCDDVLLVASCVGSSLAIVPIQLNPELKVISLRDNKIAKVHFEFGFYKNMRSLDVSNNKITSLGNKNFEMQAKLTTLNLSNNFIGNLSKDTFKGLKNLRVLDLSGNQLESLDGGAFSNLPNLVELYFINNRIYHIGNSVFEKLNNLLVLKIDDNQLLDIPTQSLKHLPQLEYLGLGGNLIESIEEDATPVLGNLKTLTLNSNVISQIDRAAFDGLISLEYLDLSDNNLTTIPTESLSKLNNLSELDLSGNTFRMLKPVAFQSLFELRKVKLSRLARLWKIDVRAFVDNIKLESIEMNDNEMLTGLPWRLFHGNPSLVDVSVRGNGLTSLDASHFPLDQLTTLSLGGNPLHCNCSLLWLWLLSHDQTNAITANNSLQDVTPLLDLSSIRCSAPPVWRGVMLSDVSESAVRCDASWIAILLVALAVTLLLLVACVLVVLRCRNKEKRNMEDLDVQHRMHQNGAVLMLLGQQDNLDNFVLRTNKDLVNSLNAEHQFPHRLATWEAATRDLNHQDHSMGLYNGQYGLNGSIKKPKHIVYV